MNIQKITLLSALTLLFACAEKPAGVTISGTIENRTADSVAFKVAGKDTTFYAAIDTMSCYNYFKADFELDTAAYVYFIHGEESSAMYLHGDEYITMSVNTEEFDESITYKGSPESSFLAKKYLTEEDADFWSKLYSTTWEDFQPLLEAHNNLVLEELHTLTNEGFISKEKEVMQQMSEYFERTITTFAKLPQPGTPAIDFTYEDRTGKSHSLSDFKGNVVYVDVWATWCGPCKREIPFLQELEADFHGKDLTFLSVSVDDDRTAWEVMLDEKEMGGVQLIGDKGWGSELMQSYAINGIPRFLLIDKEGNIISLMAPRPSSEEIRELLDSNL